MPLRTDQTPSPPQAPFDPAPSNPAPPDTTVFEAQAASASASREARNRAPTGDAPLPPSRPRNPSTGVAENPGPSPLRRREERALLPRQAPGYAPFQSEGREPGMAPQAGAQPFNTAARRRGPDPEWESSPSYRPFNPGRARQPARLPAPSSHEQVAAASNQLETLKGLLDAVPQDQRAATINRRQVGGLTLLNAAAYDGNETIYNYLKQQGGNEGVENGQGVTPAEVLAQFTDIEKAIDPAVLPGGSLIQAWIGEQVGSPAPVASESVSPPIAEPLDLSPTQTAGYYAAIINTNMLRQKTIGTFLGSGQANFVDFGQFHIVGFDGWNTDDQTSYILSILRGMAEASRYPAARIVLNRVFDGPPDQVLVGPKQQLNMPDDDLTGYNFGTGLARVSLSLIDGHMAEEDYDIETGIQYVHNWATPHNLPFWLTMLHEFIHAADHRNGDVYSQHPDIIVNGENVSIIEVHAVGVGPFRDAEGTENDIRAQAGLPRRDFVNDIRELGPDGLYGSPDDYWNRPGYDFSQLPSWQ